MKATLGCRRQASAQRCCVSTEATHLAVHSELSDSAPAEVSLTSAASDTSSRHLPKPSCERPSTTAKTW